MVKLAIDFTIKKLKQLASAKETELIEACDEIEKSVTALKDLREKITIDDRLVVKEIEELVYSIEDVFQVYGRRTRSSRIMLLFKRRDGAENQKEVKSKIARMCDKIKQFAALHDVMPAQPHNNNYKQQRRQQNYVCKHEEGAVGMEEEKDLIVPKLLDTTQNPEVDFLTIIIWGRSGIGKTTLAHEICSDNRIDSVFKKVTIRASEYNNINYPLQLVLELFEGFVQEHSNLSTTSLQKKVTDHLEKSRTLIILEDVRSIDDWRTLRSALKAKGCRILVTTQSIKVADGLPDEIYIHEKRPLTEKDSWELLKKKLVCPKKDPGVEIERPMASETNPGAESESTVCGEIHPVAEIEPAMARMGREMVKLCEGIPGAIIELAKQLTGKSASEWEMFQKNARSYLSQVLAPSYDELSDDQKLYFLYLGKFREDPEIEPEKLCHLWAIEGLILPQDDMTLLALTQEHLTDLALKRMIDVRQIIELKSCSLVQSIGHTCVSKAEEINFLKVMDLQMSTGDNQSLLSFNNTHRLVIYLGKYDAPRVTPELARNLRSLRIIRVHDEHQQLEEFVWPSIMSKIKKFKALRILDFGRVDFQRGQLPEGIFDLPFLKFLSFEGCFLKELPSSIRNLSYLEVLDLRIKDTCIIIIPDVLRRMGRLIHLYLPRAFQPQNGKKLRLDGLAELQTLKNFNSKLCEIRDLFKLIRLRNLDAKVENSLEDLKLITERLKIGGQKWLGSSIEVKNFDCYTQTKHNVFRQLFKFGFPPILSFEGYIDPLPSHNDISQNFTEIVLRSTQLKQDPMATLENLANLRLLVLADDAFLGEKMVCSASGFPELKHLELSSLFFFQEWRVENLAMQSLSHLKIENCKKLETLPDDSKFLDSLHEFKAIKMAKLFIEEVRERYNNLKRPPSLILDC